MTLGFDASTTCVGWAIYNGIEIIDAGFVNISKLDTNKEKVLYVISELERNLHINSITGINLEAALSGFKGKMTSQQTIILLSRFNALFEYIISERFKLPVNLINVASARKKVLGKASCKGMTGKEYVLQQIDVLFPYIHKFDKLNKRNTWDAHNADMYDAVIIASY